VIRRFTGTSTNKVDAKGRVSVPAPYRRVLEALDPEWSEGRQPSVYLFWGDPRAKHLTAYSAAAMLEIWKQIDLLPRGSEDRRRLNTLYYKMTYHTTVDDSGRLTLPKELRDRVEITDSAAFNAAGDTFEIMRPEADAPAQNDLDAWLLAQPDTFDPASLLPPLPPASE
jgi:MraZ protein